MGVGISFIPAHNTAEVYIKAEMLASIPLLFAVGTTFAIPVLLVWGWVRWVKDKTEKQRSSSSTFSLVGFSLATGSAALAVATHLYARFVHNLALSDPALMKIYAFGCLLSIAGIAFAVAGSGRPNPVRWLAPVCAFGTLIFWLMAMSTV